MQVEFQEAGERLVARPKGRMEASDGDAQSVPLEQQLTPATRSVAIDLDQLEFVNFGGIRALLRLARSLKGSERSLEFDGGGEIVRDALDQAGLDDLFQFTPPFVSNRGKQS